MATFRSCIFLTDLTDKRPAGWAGPDSTRDEVHHWTKNGDMLRLGDVYKDEMEYDALTFHDVRAVHLRFVSRNCDVIFVYL